MDQQREGVWPNGSKPNYVYIIYLQTLMPLSNLNMYVVYLLF
jgi:hypothetical protein